MVVATDCIYVFYVLKLILYIVKKNFNITLKKEVDLLVVQTSYTPKTVEVSENQKKNKHKYQLKRNQSDKGNTDIVKYCLCLPKGCLVNA